jgi:hypothetical protein
VLRHLRAPLPEGQVPPAKVDIHVWIEVHASSCLQTKALFGGGNPQPNVSTKHVSDGLGFEKAEYASGDVVCRLD